jgi:superfamily I DNA/RNA helicase
VPKEYKGKDEIGEIRTINNLKEINIDNNNSWLFLGRNNMFLSVYKKFFESKGMIYNYKNELSVKYSEIEAIRNYVSLQKGDINHIPSSLNIHLKPDFNLKEEWYNSFKWKENKITYLRDVIKNKNHKDLRTNINIETIHSIKGGEAENVVVQEDITKNVKSNLENNPDSEHRVFYVGVTRTKKNLYILQNTSKNYYNLRRYVNG